MKNDIFQSMGITNKNTKDELDKILDKYSCLYRKN